MIPDEDGVSSAWVRQSFVEDLDFDENGEITVEVPHKTNPGETLTVTFKRIKLGETYNDK